MHAGTRMLHLEQSLVVLGQALTIGDMMQFAGERLGGSVGRWAGGWAGRLVSG